jgi:polyhydroxybutyrate depolymerase
VAICDITIVDRVILRDECQGEAPMPQSGDADALMSVASQSTPPRPTSRLVRWGCDALWLLALAVIVKCMLGSGPAGLIGGRPRERDAVHVDPHGAGPAAPDRAANLDAASHRLASRPSSSKASAPPPARGGAAWAAMPVPDASSAARAATARNPVPGDHWHQVVVAPGAAARDYFVHVPTRSAATTAGWPVVVALHGAGSDARGMSRMTRLSEKADASGFLVAYPNGTPLASDLLRTWNAGSCCGSAAAGNVDDVAFIAAVLDDLESRYPIDPSRVYLTGLSNGAMMAYRLASELSDRFAAVAAVAGGMAQTRAQPRRPVPLLHIHGDADEVASYHGGLGAHSVARWAHQSVPQTIEAWVRANGCDPTPEVDRLPDRVADGTTVRRQTYRPRAGASAPVTANPMTQPPRDAEARSMEQVTRGTQAGAALPEPGTDAAEEANPGAGTRVTLLGAGALPGAEVVLIVVEGGGHAWPGRPSPDIVVGGVRLSRLNPNIVRFGQSTRDVHANDLIWSFFERHRLEPRSLAAAASTPRSASP